MAQNARAERDKQMAGGTKTSPETAPAIGIAGAASTADPKKTKRRAGHAENTMIGQRTSAGAAKAGLARRKSGTVDIADGHRSAAAAKTIGCALQGHTEGSLAKTTT